MSKLVITGLQTCGRKDAVYSEIRKYIDEIGAVEEIITGGLPGVEQMAKEYAIENQIKYTEIAADWQSDLNAAGMIRDTRLAEYATHLLVLSDGINSVAKNLIAEATVTGVSIKTVGIFTPPRMQTEKEQKAAEIADCLLSYH